MKKPKYTKSEKWLESKKKTHAQLRVVNAPRNVAIYKMKESNCPMLDIQIKYHLSDERIRQIHRTVQGMIDRNEIDPDLFDS